MYALKLTIKIMMTMVATISFFACFYTTINVLMDNCDSKIMFAWFILWYLSGRIARNADKCLNDED